MKEEIKEIKKRDYRFPILICVIIVVTFILINCIDVAVEKINIHIDEIFEEYESNNIQNNVNTKEENVPDLDLIVSDWVYNNLMFFDNTLQLVQHGIQTDTTLKIDGKSIECYTYTISLYHHGIKENDYILWISKKNPKFDIYVFERMPYTTV